MARFRSRVVEIDAVNWSGPEDDHLSWPSWAVSAWVEEAIRFDQRGPCLWIKTLEGTMKASPGDWIIRGTEGELYPCKPSVFERKYQAVDDDDGPDVEWVDLTRLGSEFEQRMTVGPPERWQYRRRGSQLWRAGTP